jgi:hypothetical protein
MKILRKWVKKGGKGKLKNKKVKLDEINVEDDGESPEEQDGDD